MPKKKSIKLSASRFRVAADAITDFVEKSGALKEDFHSWCTDYAIIQLYLEFETLMLDTIAGAINNDAKTISTTVGVNFPKHMSLAVCRYLVIEIGRASCRERV